MVAAESYFPSLGQWGWLMILPFRQHRITSWEPHITSHCLIISLYILISPPLLHTSSYHHFIFISSYHLMQLVVKLETVSIAHLLITVSANLKTICSNWLHLHHMTYTRTTWMICGSLHISFVKHVDCWGLLCPDTVDRNRSLCPCLISQWVIVFGKIFVNCPRIEINLFLQNARSW